MRILIAEDSLLSRRMLEAVLVKWGYDVVVTENGDAAWEVLQREDAPRLAILDWMMPGLDGPDICRKLRARRGSESTYVLLLTARTDKEDIVVGLEAGANDYIAKPFHNQELRARLSVGMRIVELQQELADRVHELEDLNRQLEKLSSLDGLTGIPNRRYLDADIEREWNRAMRGGNALAFLMCDIDFFKNYNDSLGHLAGDACLKAVAETLHGGARRAGDLVARYGGEEFAVLLADTDMDEARRIAESLRAAVEALDMKHPASKTSERVTVSIGAAAVAPSLGEKPERLIEAADRALFQAKKQGRNRVCEAPAPKIESATA